MSDTERLADGQEQTLRELQAIATTLDVQDGLMLIGATARLLQLDWPLNHKQRTTKDVDFVVQMEDWSQHQALVERAVKAGFQKLAQEHRLRHLATETLIDLVPFGGLENPKGTIQWPRSQRDMSVWGMQEAHQEASFLEVASELKIRVVTLPCLVALKMFAWLDRRHSDKGQGDLADANFILLHCEKLPKYEQVSWNAFERATEIAKSLERVDQLDYTEHVGASIIGSTLKTVLQPETKSHLREILSPLAKDAYHPAIEQLIPLFDTEQRDHREIVSLRFALLLQFLSI